MSKSYFQKKISTPAAAPAAPVVPVAVPVPAAVQAAPVPAAVPAAPVVPAPAAPAPAAPAPAALRAPRRAWAPVGILGSEDEHGRPLSAIPVRNRGPRM